MNDKFVTREDVRNLWRGIGFGLLFAVPFWAAVLYWWLR